MLIAVSIAVLFVYTYLVYTLGFENGWEGCADARRTSARKKK